MAYLHLDVLYSSFRELTPNTAFSSKLRMKLKDRPWRTIQRYECRRFEIAVHCPRPHDRQTRKGLVKPENSCTITLTESELNLLVSGLVVFERDQLRLADLAQEDGSTLEAEARRLSATKIKQLTDRIADTPLSA